MTKSVRVAIYTRVSTDERLDQEFNSLDAQRAAVEAFVASQKSDGWVALTERYDDGGFTGANTNRPAFLQLMADVDAGRVDVIAVYKLDRLSRSLADFTTTLGRLDKKSVGFVSVTQQFSTTTSAGRMIVNILATFAQFEREQIAERTRDKMGATRRRGQWTGGRPVLGYDVKDKKLVVNEAEAEQVSTIFSTFLQLQSVTAVVEGICGMRTKFYAWRGGQRGGNRYSKSYVRRILETELYVGKVSYRGELYAGAHEAIVDAETWEAVQVLLRKSPGVAPTHQNGRALLSGLLKCAVCGSKYAHHFAQKAGRRYAYYVCQRVLKESATACPGARMPAAQADAFVLQQIQAIGKDPGLVAETIRATQEAHERESPRLRQVGEALNADIKAFEAKRTHFLNAIGQAGESPSGLVERLREIEMELAATRELAEATRNELRTLEKSVVSEDQVRVALERFDPIWEALSTQERRRVLHLLIEELRYDARDGSIEIRFCAPGVRMLAEAKETVVA